MVKGSEQQEMNREHAQRSTHEMAQSGAAMGQATKEAMMSSAYVARDTGFDAMNSLRKMGGQTANMVWRNMRNMWDSLQRTTSQYPMLRMFIYVFMGLAAIPLGGFVTFVTITMAGVFMTAAVIASLIEGALFMTGFFMMLPLLGLALLGSFAVVSGYMMFRTMLWVAHTVATYMGLGERTLSNFEDQMKGIGEPIRPHELLVGKSEFPSGQPIGAKH